MPYRVVTALAGLVLAIALTGQARALPLNVPVPNNAFITYDGLDWAWGGPCPFQGECGDNNVTGEAGGDLTFQATQGWRLPTATEILGLPTDFAMMFVFPGANVPLGGTDPVSGALFLGGDPSGAAACATPYFSTTVSYCDWGDGVGNEDGGAWATQASDEFFEQLFVRAAVPEPASLALFGTCLAGLALARRRRTA